MARRRWPLLAGGLLLLLARNAPHSPCLARGLWPSQPPPARLPRRAEEGEGAGGDWRDFRARLVQQEQAEKAADPAEQEPGAPEEEEGWAYVTPLIEQGSILLSSPGDHFATGQQYFHKAVILIVEHTSEFTRGIILNRPSAFKTGDLENIDLEEELPGVFTNGTEWNVWHGGDCQGLNARRQLWGGGAVYYCMHTLARLENISTTVIKGVYFIDLDVAQGLVAKGMADKDEFLLLVGYCGWSPGQLQGELDRGDTWIMAAADRKVLLGKLREDQAALTKRMEAAQSSASGLSAGDVGDGIADWGQLFTTVKKQALEQDEAEGEAEAEAAHNDEMLRLWIARCLIPTRLKADPEFPGSPAALSDAATAAALDLKRGTILRASASAWLLGKPAERPEFDGMLAGQYLHKAVLLVLNDFSAGKEEPAILCLLNGPRTGTGRTENGTSFDMHFGGPFQPAGSSAFEVGKKGYSFKGVVLFRGEAFREVMALRALEVAEGVDLDEVLEVPAEDRWQAAGGRLETIKASATSLTGDRQRRKWYQKYIGLELPE